MVKYVSIENKRILGMQDEMLKIILFFCLFFLEMEFLIIYLKEIR